MNDKLAVLILDDEPIVCERIKEYLDGKGFYVETFTESEKAIHRMEEKSFDVVVTDLKMSGPTGMDVLRFIRDKLPSTRGILITAYGVLESVREAEVLGAFEIVHKPFKLSEIYKAVVKAAKRARE